MTGGKSNPTYRLTDGGAHWILRRPPSVTLAAAHDMGREYAVSSTAADTPLPVPRRPALCLATRVLATATRRGLRPSFQPVFQDPYDSLSPRLRIRDAVAEPLRVQGRWDPVGGPDLVTELLETVGLDPRLGHRLPHELSHGQCQRVGIARALASDPRLLVLDEPVSALDPSVRAGVLNLLTDLQERMGLSYLFICHDLAVVRHVAYRVAVMDRGRIVETLPAAALYGQGEVHPRTRELLTTAFPRPRAAGAPR
ncbi:ATP-binding cassette domain-containing protein [Streptomyces sp. NBC_01353]|uniref:ATP-binding cassette domain-containing protein n=1 Tax=Streptomyces sp. NBC_01353 TaxID=2903835 RepID=UPI002E3389BB|nr:ATP-binding cassette domain-containing protein [Streptomyces sp. NBC_01353]